MSDNFRVIEVCGCVSACKCFVSFSVVVFVFRVLLICGIGVAKSYEIREFDQEPGIYFEKIGEYYRVESDWKVAISVDVSTVRHRYNQLHEFTGKTQYYCKELEYLDNVAKVNCESMTALLNKDKEQLKAMLAHIDFLESSSAVGKKRGLVDGVDSLAKYLFGVMDANSEKLINDQLDALNAGQEVLNGAVKSQLRVLNKTVVHLNNLEDVLRNNEVVLSNVTNRLGKALDEYAQRGVLTEYFVTVNAIMSDLLRDIERIIEFTLHLRRGVIHPAVISQEVILAQVTEAVPKLPEGMQFPFKVSKESWPLVEKVSEVTAYVKGSDIVTVLSLPLVSYPVYELVSVVPLPVHNHGNVYAFVDIGHSIIGVGREGKTYSEMSEEELRKCKNVGGHYFCGKSTPVYYVSSKSPCKVRMYLREGGDECDLRYVATNQTLWVALRDPLTWLYSTHGKEEVTIQCTGGTEHVATVKRTGRVTLSENCKMLTREMYIKTREGSRGTDVKVYLSEYNLSVPEIALTHKTSFTPVKLKNVVSGEELTRLSTRISKVMENVDNARSGGGVHPHVICTVSVSGTLVVIIIIVALVIAVKCVKKKN